MYLDFLTLAAIGDALRERIAGARVQSIVQPSPQAIVCEMYAGERRYLFLSAEPQEPAVALLARPLRRGVEQPSPLLLLMRKRFRGARLTRIEQPPHERILQLTFARGEETITLICELMGRLSNLILVDEDEIVLDAVKRVPSSVNRYRVIQPQRAYVPPPPQERAQPFTVTAAMLLAYRADSPGKTMDRLLVTHVAGMSPVLAREIVHRADLDVKAEDLSPAQAGALVHEIHSLYGRVESHAWAPSIAHKGVGDRRRAELAAPYALTHRDDWEPCRDILAAVHHVLQSRGALDAYARVRARLLEVVAQARERLQRRHAILTDSLPKDEDDALLLAKANAILALQHTIRPRQDSLTIPADIFAGLTGEAHHQPLTVQLDPSISAVENAQRLFRRHQKLQAARQSVPPLIQQVEQRLAFLDQAETDIEMADSRPALDEIAAMLQEAGHLRARKKRQQASGASEPLRVEAPDGGLILIGRNSRQNALVTFRLGRPDDIWLHAHGVAGSHVIYRPVGSTPDKDALKVAAQLAACYSAARKHTAVQVDYTQRKHVRAIRDAGPGMVTYRNEQTLVVAPLPPDDVKEA